MKSYRNPETGVFYRTQAEARAAGPFEPIDIPTSHAELIAFVNGLITPDISIDGPNDATWPGDVNGIDIEHPYRNGAPTRVFMGSRDPDAIFTCSNCGHNNRNSYDG